MATSSEAHAFSLDARLAFLQIHRSASLTHHGRVPRPLVSCARHLLAYCSTSRSVVRCGVEEKRTPQRVWCGRQGGTMSINYTDFLLAQREYDAAQCNTVGGTAFGAGTVYSAQTQTFLATMGMFIMRK